MNTQVALVIPANIWFCPYLKIYTALLDQWKVTYSIICWDRTATSEKGDNVYAFSARQSENKVSKLWGYLRFARFAKKSIRKSGAKKIIVFSAQAGLFIARYLKKEFKGEYIFDFRDLSIEQSRIFRQPFNALLANSYANVVSSPGFLRCLPRDFSYIMCHNFIAGDVEKALNDKEPTLPMHPIDILTIGGIRDFESNAPLMDAVGNKKDFNLRFVGKGPSAQALMLHAKKNGYQNVEFEGYYKKEDEASFIDASTFLNIYYPDWLSHATALSNRFYNSIIYRRPMIVTKGQVQGDYCEKYNLGVAVDDSKKIPELLKEWLAVTDLREYDKRCSRLLSCFLQEQTIFCDKFKRFLGVE